MRGQVHSVVQHYNDLQLSSRGALFVRCSCEMWTEEIWKCLISKEKQNFHPFFSAFSLLTEKEQEPKLTCEYCGWVDFAYTFKGSKRFCSVVCAKRQVTCLD